MNTTTKKRKRRPSMAGVMSRLEEVERKQEENAIGFAKRMMAFESALERLRGHFTVAVREALECQSRVAPAINWDGDITQLSAAQFKKLLPRLERICLDVKPTRKAKR